MKGMRKVVYLQLHEAGTFVPDFIPNFGNTLPPLNKSINLTMWDAGDKILLQIVQASGKLREAFIPITAIKIALYAPAADLKPVA